MNLQDLKIGDLVIAAATLIGPIAAVQITRLADRRRARDDEQRRIFSILMSTRAMFLDARHIESLNLVDVVFSSKTRSERAIRDAWRSYLDHLNTKQVSPEIWGQRRVELLTELLYAMGQHLKLDYDRIHIKNECYYPRGWGDAADENNKIRAWAARIAEGKVALPVIVYPPAEAPAPPAPNAGPPPHEGPPAS
jgi:hypothetical protein